MAGRIRLLLGSQPLDAGVPHHVLEVVEGLDPARYAVEVACPRESVLWKALSGRPDVVLHDLRTGREPSPADLATVVRLLPLVRRADVVHAHSSKAGFLLRLAAVLTGRRGRCVFTPHAWSFWAFSDRRAWLYRTLERVAARWCRTIVVVSEAERRAGLEAGIGDPSQYRVVLNGLDLDRFAAPPAPVAGRVLVVGRLSRQKRPDLALRAVAIVRERLPHVEVVFVGDGPLRPDAERLAGELGLGAAARFVGERDDVPALLSEAACLLLPSEWEACPFSVLEAMAAGVPVVATAVGGVPELVEDGATGVLVPPTSAAQLASALEALLADPGRARELGAAGRAEAHRRFSRGRMVDALAAIYEDVA